MNLMGRFRKRSLQEAFTLVESLVVVLIVGVLLALVFPNFSSFRLKAEGVVCTGKLRNLWIAFSTQLNDGNGWPQLPTNIPIGTQAEEQWWLTYSSNAMGLSANDWNCPTIARMARASTATSTNLISYLPTLFDSKPMTPKSWPRMPWFTEVLSVHGSGNLTVRTDGSVCPIQDP